MLEIELAQEIEVVQIEARIELPSNLKISISILDFTKERNNSARVFSRKDIIINQTQ
jgi:hypothetical protein